MEYKSLYEQLLAELDVAGKIRVLTGEQNMKILEELSEGMGEWTMQERKRRFDSEQELKTIILK